MSKTVIVKLKTAGYRTGPFTLSDNLGVVYGTNLSIQDVVAGITCITADSVTTMVLQSTGKCQTVLSFAIQDLMIAQILAIPTFKYVNTSRLWRHLTDVVNYNKYYGNIEPYIIEYPFAYENQDEIVQNIRDYTIAYKYLSIPDGVYNDNNKVQTDDQYFNKAIIYNGQQCSGVLNLVSKPKNNMSQYMLYPMYNTTSKTITYTKSDSVYQYNTFWNILSNKSVPAFTTSCESMSIDKVVNQSNMDYSTRSFRKDTIRAKGLFVRHILDNTSEAHLVSMFIISPSMISYK